MSWTFIHVQIQLKIQKLQIFGKFDLDVYTRPTHLSYNPFPS